MSEVNEAYLDFLSIEKHEPTAMFEQDLVSISHIDTMERAEEILRLARLGLWAEQHGIPAFKVHHIAWEKSPLGEHLDPKCAFCLAIAALPESEKGKK